jgi:nitrogen PTS system EIIA component
MQPPEPVNLRLALVDVSAKGPRELARQVAEALAPLAGLDPERVSELFAEAATREGASLGEGVAIPHAVLEGVPERVVALAVTRSAVDIPTLDGRRPDLFFFVLAPPGHPQGHLRMLAHLAHLAQSRTLRDGLREARTPEDALALVRAAEERHGVVRRAVAADHAMLVISIGGEKAVDALLVELLDRQPEDVCVLEAQSLREAATREVPIFTGFRDIFGDPGGRRVILAEVLAEEVDGVVALVERVCREHGTLDAHVAAMPVHRTWRPERPEPAEPKGH